MSSPEGVTQGGPPPSDAIGSSINNCNLIDLNDRFIDKINKMMTNYNYS